MMRRRLDSTQRAKLVTLSTFSVDIENGLQNLQNIYAAAKEGIGILALTLSLQGVALGAGSKLFLPRSFAGWTWLVVILGCLFLYLFFFYFAVSMHFVAPYRLQLRFFTPSYFETNGGWGENFPFSARFFSLCSYLRFIPFLQGGFICSE